MELMSCVCYFVLEAFDWKIRGVLVFEKLIRVRFVFILLVKALIWVITSFDLDIPLYFVS